MEVFIAYKAGSKWEGGGGSFYLFFVPRLNPSGEHHDLFCFAVLLWSLSAVILKGLLFCLLLS